MVKSWLRLKIRGWIFGPAPAAPNRRCGPALGPRKRGGGHIVSSIQHDCADYESNQVSLGVLGAYRVAVAVGAVTDGGVAIPAGWPEPGAGFGSEWRENYPTIAATLYTTAADIPTAAYAGCEPRIKATVFQSRESSHKFEVDRAGLRRVA